MTKEIEAQIFNEIAKNFLLTLQNREYLDGVLPLVHTYHYSYLHLTRHKKRFKELGLIEIQKVGRCDRLVLTTKGRRIADSLKAFIDGIKNDSDDQE